MIPKDTWVQADIHFLLVNDPLFVRPEEFRPDRYIAEDGRTLRSVSVYLLRCASGCT